MNLFEVEDESKKEQDPVCQDAEAKSLTGGSARETEARTQHESSI
jgi:hypothetical protein